jgi:uncharacterized protein
VALDLPLVLPFIFLGALLYSSVGHGGATVYLAILTLAGYLVGPLVTTVLVLNILAATIAFFMFQRAGHLRWRLLLPFVITSVPMAYLGGRATFSSDTQSYILAAALLLAAARLLFVPRPPNLHVPQTGWAFRIGAPVLGIVLGFLAGATGIGGGIFLSPILLAFGWANVKEAGNVASAFIVLNSIAGLAAKIPDTPLDIRILLPMAVVVVSGALIGSFVGARKLPLRWLQVLLGLVLVAAGIKTLM